MLPAMLKMQSALADTGSPYSGVVSSLTTTLHHVWGAGLVLTDGAESKHADGSTIDRGVDLLHAFPVADVHVRMRWWQLRQPDVARMTNREFVSLGLHDVSDSVGSARTMNTHALDQFLFIALPYVCLFTFLLMTIYRYRHQSFSYSSLSSQFLENKQHFWAVVPFHYGILAVTAGHLIAF